MLFFLFVYSESLHSASKQDMEIQAIKRVMTERLSKKPSIVHKKLPRKNDTNAARNHYYWPSKFDPTLENQNEKIKDAINQKRGFLEMHLPSDISYEYSFGDISLLTWNIYEKTISISAMDNLFESIKELLDHIHPSVLALQGVRKELIDKLNEFSGNTHYRITALDRFDIDNTKGAHIYQPIIYDSEVFSLIKSDALSNNGHVFATFAKLKDKRNNNNELTIVNLDNSYVDSSLVNQNLSSLLADALDDKEVATHPLVIMGGIGTKTAFLNELFSNGYINTLKSDRHNENLRETTMHGGNG